MMAIRYCVAVLLTLSACLLAQAAALKAANGRTLKGESNFFSSVARLQTGLAPPPRIVLAGSSMTGRLPDRSVGWAGVANMGCDGGSAVTALKAIAAGTFPAPEAVVVEANTLRMGIGARPGDIDRVIESPWFWAGVHAPLLGASARPASLVYSALLAGRVGRYGKPVGHPLERQSPPTAWPAPVPLAADAEAATTHVCDLLSVVRGRGVNVMLVRLPCRRERGGDWLDVAREVSRRTGCALLDLETLQGAADLQFTDGVHMNAASAAVCLDRIIAAYAAIQGDRAP
jgi:hypothetical protein